MRLFTAVEIERDVAAAAIRLAGELRERVEASAPHARLIWIPAERLHITVQFIGHVDAGRADRVRHVLEAPLLTPHFVASIAGAGVFPPRGAPRVLWAGIARGLESMQALAAEVRQRLATVPLELDAGAYHPHVTLARVREGRGLRSASLVKGLTDRDLGPTQVGAITLFESRLSPQGPTYVPLQRTRLA